MAVSPYAGVIAAAQLSIAGAPVLYTPAAGGTGITITAIVRQSRRAIDADGQPITTSSPFARLSVGDVPSPARNDVITEADGTVWYVEAANQMQSSLWMLDLRKERVR